MSCLFLIVHIELSKFARFLTRLCTILRKFLDYYNVFYVHREIHLIVELDVKLNYPRRKQLANSKRTELKKAYFHTLTDYLLLAVSGETSEC